MSLAATPSSTSRHTSHGHRFFAAWQLVPAIFVALIGFLAVAPDGMAEPLQAVASWLLVALVAVFAVVAIAKGLERLLECDGD